MKYTLKSLTRAVLRMFSLNKKSHEEEKTNTSEPVKNVPVHGGLKERIDFGKIIGEWRSVDGKLSFPTTIGILHYNSNGLVHLVPARPNAHNELLEKPLMGCKFKELIYVTQHMLSSENFPLLRGVAVDWNGPTIILHFYHDGPLTDEMEDDYRCIGTEIVAYYNVITFEENINRLDKPNPLPLHKWWALKEN